MTFMGFSEEDFTVNTPMPICVTPPQDTNKWQLRA
jgi:hypothetical protein